MKNARKKGFTLVELLVVIAIIALLVSILMPALGRAREMAKRVQCASQERGIGQGMALYQNDYRDSNPRIGRLDTANSKFGHGKYLELADVVAAGNFFCDQSLIHEDKACRVNSCLYLLVKYEDIVPKMFLCPSDDLVEEMDLQEVILVEPLVESWEDLNEFKSNGNVSYSYNDPYRQLLDASASSALVLMADQSPRYTEENGEVTSTQSSDSPEGGTSGAASPQDSDWDWTDEDGDNPNHGNTKNHASEVQNVLFADMHVKKHEKPTVGIGEDNIFTYWSTYPTTLVDDKMIGSWAVAGGQQNTAAEAAQTEQDSYLGN